MTNIPSAFLILAAITTAAADDVAIDFGTLGSPTGDGFISCSEKSIWSKNAPMGFINGDKITSHCNAIDNTEKASSWSGQMARPDVYLNKLTCDWVSSSAPATLRINVPTGTYQIWAVIGPSGKEGKSHFQVWDTRIAYTGKNGSTESLHPITCFGQSESHVVTFEATSNGVIDIHFETQSKWIINALAVVPKGEWNDVREKKLDRYEQDIYLLPSDVLSKWKHTPYVENKKAGEFTEDERKQGFAVWSRHWSENVWPNSIPQRSEIKAEERIFATPGEYEPITFSLFALSDLRKVNVRFTDLVSPAGRISPSDIDIRYVKYMWVKPNYKADGTYYRAPDVLMPFRQPQDIAKMENLRVWSTIHIPTDTPAGIYSGHAIIYRDNNEEARVPVHVRVLPFQLKSDPDALYGQYYISPLRAAAFAPDGYSREWLRKKMESEYQDMLIHGTSLVTMNIFQKRGKPANGKKWELDYDTLDEQIALNKRLGFSAPIPLLFPAGWQYTVRNGKGWGPHLSAVQMQPKDYFDDIATMVREIEEERARRSWPEFAYYPVDEPSTEKQSVEFMKEILAAIKQIPGVRTYITADPSHAAFAPLKGLVDIWCCQPFSLDRETIISETKRAPGTEYWCYPNHISGENDHTPVIGGRMTYGFGFWRSGFKALIPWIYSQNIGNPWNYLDGETMDFFNRTDHDGTPIPVTLWEGFREGYDDRRYIYTLSLAIADARRSGRESAAQSGEKILSYVWNSIKTQKKYIRDHMWKGGDFDAYRWAIAGKIIELTKN